MSAGEPLSSDHTDYFEEVRELHDWQLVYYGAEYSDTGVMVVADQQVEALSHEAQAAPLHAYITAETDQAAASRIRHDAELLAGGAVMHNLRLSVTSEQLASLADKAEEAESEESPTLIASARDYKETWLEGYTKHTATRAWGNLQSGFNAHRIYGESHWRGQAFADSGVTMHVDESRGKYRVKDEDYSVDVQSLKAAVDSGKILEIYDLGKNQAGALGLFAQKMIAQAESSRQSDDLI